MTHGSIAYSFAVLRIRALRCVVALMLGSLASTAVAEEQWDSTPTCRPDGPLATVPELPEASGIAVSGRVPGRLWAHNDSGQPILFALDAKGAVTGRLNLTGATVEDWEALAIGPCPAGSCIYVADIGDNDAERKRITIYRLPEPSAGETSAAVKDVFHATYPDGAHDAEALLITPTGDLLIVTKGGTGSVSLYRFPRELRPDATHQLERVGKPRGPGKPSDRITDGAVSADGQWVVLRTGQSLAFHRTAELMAGNWSEVRRVDLKAVGEAQGEGVALGANNTVFLAGEGGGKSQPGTFATFTCAANQ